MTTYKLVLPGHLNHYGFLFGGYLLQWVDEASWIAASNAYPGCRFVTIGMDRVEFRKGVRKGTILRLVCDSEKVGRTSVTYRVEVFRQSLPASGNAEPVFNTRVTLVRVDARGRKQALPEATTAPAGNGAGH